MENAEKLFVFSERRYGTTSLVRAALRSYAEQQASVVIFIRPTNRKRPRRRYWSRPSCYVGNGQANADIDSPSIPIPELFSTAFKPLKHHHHSKIFNRHPPLPLKNPRKSTQSNAARTSFKPFLENDASIFTRHFQSPKMRKGIGNTTAWTGSGIRTKKLEHVFSTPGPSLKH